MHPVFDKLHYHGKLVYRHAKKHHKTYLWGMAGFFGLFKIFSFIVVGISGYITTYAFNSSLTLHIPASTIAWEVSPRVEFSLTGIADKIDTISDISFTLPLDTDVAFVDTILSMDNCLDTFPITLEMQQPGIWQMSADDMSGLVAQIQEKTSILTLQLPPGLSLDTQKVALHMTYLPVGEDTASSSEAAKDAPLDAYHKVDYLLDTQQTTSLIQDATTVKPLLLESVDQAITVEIPETTTITDEQGNKFYGELHPPQEIALDEIDYPDAENIKYAFSVGNPDESLHFVDTDNSSQDLTFRVQVDSGSFASGQQVLTYYADDTDTSLQFLSIVVVQQDGSGNLFVQMQVDHMTEFFIEGYESEILQMFVGDESCENEVDTITYADGAKDVDIHICTTGNPDVLATFTDMRVSMIDLSDLSIQGLNGFFDPNYVGYFFKATNFTQTEGTVPIFVEYYYNGGASSVTVTDTVRIAKVLDNAYTVYEAGSNVPLELSLENIYTVVTNTSTYDTLAVDTSTRPKAMKVAVGGTHRDLSYWYGVFYPPEVVTDSRQASTGEAGLYPDFSPQKTVFAGIDGASVESLGAIFELSVYVGDTSLVPGDRAKIYYSYDGSHWSGDQQGCIVDDSYRCIFRSSHMTLFAIGYVPYDKPWSSMEFLQDEFWGMQPDSDQVKRALFGDISVSEMTAYTTLRDSACDISKLDYISIDTNNFYLLDVLSSDTVYVLEPDLYVFDQIDINNVSCVALVGRGDVTIQGTQNYSVYIENSSQIILDNIAFEGQGSQGIYIGGGINTNLTFNNLQIFNQDGNGVDSTDSQNFLINNSQIFSNRRDGVALYGNISTHVVNSQLYNNDRNGYYITAGSSYCSVNNSLLYNNGTEGLNVGDGPSFIVNNSQMYNNAGAGAVFSTTVVDVYWHQSHAFNNYNPPQVVTDPANNGIYHGTNIAYPTEGFDYFGPGNIPSLGWLYGGLWTTDRGFSCDFVSNPINGSGTAFNATGYGCDGVGVLSWDLTLPIKYLYGNTMWTGYHYYVNRQLPPVVNVNSGLSLIPYHGHRFIGEYEYDVGNTDINPPVVLFTGSTPASGTTTYNNFSVTSHIYEPNLVSLTWQEGGPSGTGYYSVYDYANLVFMSNFDGVAGIKDRDPNTTIADVSPSHVFGDILGQVVWTGNGKRNGAYYFSGSSPSVTGYIKIPHTSYSLDMTDAYSLVAWIKPNNLANYQSIFARGEVGFHDILLYLDSSSLGLFHNIANGGSPYSTSFTAPTSGDWTHIVITFSGTSTNSGDLKLYYNGVYITGVSNVRKPLDTDTSRMIGGSEAGTILGADRFFKGYIDEPRIYRRALSSGEIAQMYYSNLSAEENHWTYTANYTDVANWANGRYSFGWQGMYNSDGVQDIGMQTTGAVTYVNVQQYTCGGTGFSVVWNNDNFITGAFRNQNPTDCDIVMALYGTGSGGGDRTAYTRYRSGSNPYLGFSARTGQCNYNNMDVVRLTGGTNRLSYFTGYTIYVLASGTYLQTAPIINNSNTNLCTAFVGTTGVANIQVTSGTYDYFLDFTRHSYAIVDTVKLTLGSGSYTYAVNLGYESVLQNMTLSAFAQGIDTPDDSTPRLGSSIMNSTLMLSSYQTPANVLTGKCGVKFHYGSYRIENTVINQAYYAICDHSDDSDNPNIGIISGVKLFDNTHGIFLLDDNRTAISNSQIFNNIYGIIIDSSKNITIADTQIYSTTYAIDLRSDVFGVTMNNLQLFNNWYAIGMPSDGADMLFRESITLNNSQIYNNASDGLLLYRTKNFVVNNSHIYNNSGNGLYFAGNYNTSGIINNSAFYNNGARGIYIYSGSHFRYGKVISFDNPVNNVAVVFGSLTAGSYSTYSSLGWTGGTLDVTPCMSCSWITNPRLGANFLMDTTTYPYCSMRGQNTSWTPGTGLTYLHGINITGQKLPVFWSGTTLTGSTLTYSGAKKVAEVNSGGVYSSTSCATDNCLAGWDNDNFLDESFWAVNPTAANIICALYGSGASDPTAYTKIWDTPGYCIGAGMSVVYTGNLASVTGSNKVFVIPPGTSAYTSAGWLGTCTSIISSGGSIINNTSSINLKNSYNILDNLYVSGSATYGIYMDAIALGTTLHRTHVYNTWTGINITRSNYTFLDTVSVHNSYQGIYVNDSRITLNNNQLFNNTGDGLSLVNSLRDTINNTLIYNNSNNGVTITGGVQHYFHNTMIFGNLNHGMHVTNANEISLSNAWIYNNKTDGYNGTNDMVRYYNDNYILNNALTSSDFATGTSGPFGWQDGTMTTSKTFNKGDYMVNPRNASGVYLISTWTLTEGKTNTFVSIIPLSYSFGTGILTQGNPVFWLNNLELQPDYADPSKYIGGLTTKYTGSLVMSSMTNTTGLVVTGLASTSQVSGYSLFGDVLTSAINATINTQTGIFLTTTNGTKSVVAQLFSPTNFATHFVTQSILDTTKPTGSLTVNGGAVYASGTTVTLTLSYSDANGVANMKFSCNGGTWSVPQTPATSKTRDLVSGSGCSAGNGTKTVYVQYTDNASNTGIFSDTIIFDTTNPTGSISVNTGASSTSGTTVSLTLSGSDVNGISGMQFNCNGGSTWSTYETYATSKLRSLTAGSGCSVGDGTKRVYVRYKDAAGNQAVYADSITLDTTGPILSFTNNVATGPINTDTITASWGDATIAKWTYDSDGICPAALAANYTYTSASSMNQTTETNNTKYICLLGIDSLGNATTLLSANDINIDITPPVVSTGYISIGTTGINGNTGYFKGSITIRADVSDTVGLSGATCAYTTGAVWLSATYNAGVCTAALAPTATIAIRFRIADLAGNITTGAIGTYIYDVTGPASVSTTTPASGSYLNTGTVFLGWTLGVDAGIGLSGYYFQIATGSDFARIILSGNVYTTGVTVSGLADKSYYRRLYPFDRFVNTGSRSNAPNFTVKSTQATITNVTATNTNGAYNTGLIYIKITFSEAVFVNTINGIPKLLLNSR